jgi:hypothetical protein
MNWRDFFDLGELEKIMIPEEENEDEDASDGEKDSEKGGSDSDPSEDNIDAGEFLEMIETAFKDDKEVSFNELKAPEPIPVQPIIEVKKEEAPVKKEIPLTNHKI